MTKIPLLLVGRLQWRRVPHPLRSPAKLPSLVQVDLARSPEAQRSSPRLQPTPPPSNPYHRRQRPPSPPWLSPEPPGQQQLGGMRARRVKRTRVMWWHESCCHEHLARDEPPLGAGRPGGLSGGGATDVLTAASPYAGMRFVVAVSFSKDQLWPRPQPWLRLGAEWGRGVLQTLRTARSSSGAAAWGRTAARDHCAA
ncbi:hypothetical protein Vretimale_3177 [Volvox reticuliferus]|uniref:Uncharacterized protein n=1 Tax=Volvox reticuliferus TaxID=1737510 RepID=A0A8J4D994_9CHLO|nr:hypothetical protein Vretimale_3177 [Volvox reticuliferus]